jgi:GNAT superfamily N-acetyltransferase
MVWEGDSPHLEAHPDSLGVDPEAIVERRVRVAIGEERRLLAFSVVADAGGGIWELEGLFVDPDLMRRGIGGALAEDAAERASAAGQRRMSVVAGGDMLRAGRSGVARAGLLKGRPPGRQPGDHLVTVPS